MCMCVRVAHTWVGGRREGTQWVMNFSFSIKISVDEKRSENVTPWWLALPHANLPVILMSK